MRTVRSAFKQTLRTEERGDSAASGDALGRHRGGWPGLGLGLGAKVWGEAAVVDWRLHESQLDSMHA